MKNKLTILPITKITPKEQKELNKLKSKKHKTDQEANREVFLGIKCLWDCEC